MLIDLPDTQRTSVAAKRIDTLQRVAAQPRSPRKIYYAGHGFRVAADRQELLRRKTAVRVATLLAPKAPKPARDHALLRPPELQPTSETIWLVALGGMLGAGSGGHPQVEDTDSEQDDPG